MLIKPHDYIPCFYAKYVFDIIEKYEVIAIFKRLQKILYKRYGVGFGSFGKVS